MSRRNLLNRQAQAEWTENDERFLKRLDSAFNETRGCRECEAIRSQNDALWEQHQVMTETIRRQRTTINENRGFTFQQKQIWFAFGWAAFPAMAVMAYGLYRLFR